MKNKLTKEEMRELNISEVDIAAEKEINTAMNLDEEADTIE